MATFEVKGEKFYLNGRRTTFDEWRNILRASRKCASNFGAAGSMLGAKNITHARQRVLSRISSRFSKTVGISTFICFTAARISGL